MKYLLIISMLIVFNAFCQENSVEWSARSAAPQTYVKVQKHLGLEEDAHFVLWFGTPNTNDPFEYYVERIPTNLGKSTFTSFTFPRSITGKPIQCEGIFRLNGKNYVTYSQYNKKVGLNAFYINEVFDNGSRGEQILIANLEPIGLLNRGGYEVVVTPDKTKLVVLGYDSYRRKGESQLISLTCVSTTDFSIVWTKEHFLPTNPQKFPKYSIVADNQGNCVIYNSFKDGRDGYKSKIFGYNVEENLLTNFDTGLSAKEIIQSHRIALNKDSDFVFNGTYKDDGTGVRLRGNVMHGRVYMKISQGKIPVTSFKKPLSSKVLEAVNLESSGDELPYLINRNIVSTHFREDGNIVIMIEYTSSQKIVIPGSNPVAYEYFVIKGEVLAVCIDPNSGETLWVTKIPKYQKYSKSKYPNGIDEVSFVSVVTGNTLHYYYNHMSLGAEWEDHDGTVNSKSNLFGAKTGRPIFKYILEMDGALTYSDLKFGLPIKGLYKVEDRYPLTMIPKMSFAVGNDLFFFAISNGLQHRYGKIDLNN